MELLDFIKFITEIIVDYCFWWSNFNLESTYAFISDVHKYLIPMIDSEELEEEVRWLAGTIKDPEKRESSLEDLGVIDAKSVRITKTGLQ